MRIAAVLIGVGLAAALTACSATVVGTGHGHVVAAPAPTQSSPSDPAPSSSSSPVAVSTQPHICQERCRTVARSDLGDGYTVELAEKPGTTPVSVVILRENGTLRTAGWFDDERPGTLTCSTAPTPNCIVVDGYAMHAAKAYAISFHDGGLYLFGHLSTDTPVVVARDLDHNGWVDAIAEISTERPSYAAGPRYWATFVADGRKLMATGCTTPTMRPQRVPTIVITGDCAPA